MKTFVLGASAIITLSACVTTHPGVETESPSKTYSMSCEPRSDVRTDQFVALSCAVENKGTEWLEVKVASIEFAPKAQKAKVSTPQDINDFVDAYAYKAEKDNHNMDMFLSSLIVGGAIGAMAGGKNEAAVGAGVMMGAAGVAGVRGISKSRNEAQHSELSYSKDHLLGPGFRIPAELFTRKFVLVEMPPNSELPKTAQVCMEKPVKECLTLPIAGTDNGFNRL